MTIIGVNKTFSSMIMSQIRFENDQQVSRIAVFFVILFHHPDLSVILLLPTIRHPYNSYLAMDSGS